MFKAGETVKIVEGEGKGETGKISSTKEGQFGKQWLEVGVPDPKKPGHDKASYLKRASDVRRP